MNDYSDDNINNMVNDEMENMRPGINVHNDSVLIPTQIIDVDQNNLVISESTENVDLSVDANRLSW